MIPRSIVDHTCSIFLTNPIYEPVEELFAAIPYKISCELRTPDISIAMINKHMLLNSLADLVEVQIHGTAVVDEDGCGACFYIVGVEALRRLAELGDGAHVVDLGLHNGAGRWLGDVITFDGNGDGNTDEQDLFLNGMGNVRALLPAHR
jgi:hypothetical protein